MGEIWISAYSIEPMLDAKSWSDFYGGIGSVLSANLSHLDTNDPVRRVVKSTNDSGDFTVSFGEREESRWLHAKFRGAKVEMMIHHHKRRRVDPREFPNSINVYFDKKYCDSVSLTERVVRVFELVIEHMRPFYAYSDVVENISIKKKRFGAVNLQEELIGIFWLTYFNEKYVRFFGSDRFVGRLTTFTEEGAHIRLGEFPGEVNEQLKTEFIDRLGSESFVDPSSSLVKQIGHAALSFIDLG
ncbi:MAG: hypothetical protein JXR40_05285 [Pontiellaceae bacterium]|nr:hypothetical protein [Pontiellaceae bacterium]